MARPFDGFLGGRLIGESQELGKLGSNMQLGRGQGSSSYPTDMI